MEKRKMGINGKKNRVALNFNGPKEEKHRSEI